MLQERLAQAQFPPGTQHPQRVNPAEFIPVGTQRDARDLVAIIGQEPQGRVEGLAFDRPVHPALEVAGYMPPVILESLFIGVKDDSLIARTEGAHADACGPFRYSRSHVHSDFHVPRTTYFFETVALQAQRTLLISLSYVAHQRYPCIGPCLGDLLLRPLL